MSTRTTTVMNMESSMKYGVWSFGAREFLNRDELEVKDAMGLALHCIDNDVYDEFGIAVVGIDARARPVWHEMFWCGQFQGYDGLYDFCVEHDDILQQLGAVESIE